MLPFGLAEVPACQAQRLPLSVPARHYLLVPWRRIDPFLARFSSVFSMPSALRGQHSAAPGAMVQPAES